ncbi:MAG TPA: PadR family transcriptional regulator [Thermodesulfobacteriota bacterium]
MREFLVGFIKLHILHHAAEGPVYGLEMIEELGRHGYQVSPGTLYPTLHALEDAGLVRREEQVIGGRVRKYYRATSAGRRLLAQVRPRIRELVDEVVGSG